MFLSARWRNETRKMPVDLIPPTGFNLFTLYVIVNHLFCFSVFQRKNSTFVPEQFIYFVVGSINPVLLDFSF